jgi:4-carboxymuconolactone decarboxylase
MTNTGGTLHWALLQDERTTVTETHGRLPWPRPDELDPAAREVYNAIAGGPRASGPRLFRLSDDQGRLEGPFNSMLAAASVGMPLQDLGAAIRYRTALSQPIREVAILTVAAHHRCDFEWYAHEAVGRAAGLSDEVMAEIKAGRLPANLPAEERVTYQVCRRLLEDRALSDEVYADAVATLGTDRLIELVVLVGYYETLQLLIGATAAPLPDGVPPQFTAESA